jgi:hypothetical protein
MEVIMSSFALLVFASRQQHAHLQAVAHFYNGLSFAFAELLKERRNVPDVHINRAFDVWIIALQCLEISYWAEVRRCGRRSRQIDDAFSRVKKEGTMGCLDGIQGMPRLRNTMCRTEPLRSHLMLFWDNYLAIRVQPGSNYEDSEKAVRSMLEQIIVVAVDADEISDKLLFGMTVFVNDLMDANGDATLPNVIRSANNLCGLCRHITETVDRDLLRTYCLFFVGLVHNKRIARRFGELMFQSSRLLPGFG